jgi:hypothetical protein
VARLQLVPEAFSLVDFDAGELSGLLADAASRVGLPDGLEVRVEIDEVLPAPLAVSLADLVDGRGEVWFTGGALEDTTRARHLDRAKAGAELVGALLRVRDRLGPFADAPGDLRLDDRQRAAWDVHAEARAARVGIAGRAPRRRYLFRLACGFSDRVDEIFEVLWAAERLTWAEVRELTASLGAPPGRSAATGRSPSGPSYAELVPAEVAERHRV